ncbi:MAG: glycoside hydrolase family 9 protein [Bacteroidota bacterium]
MRLILTLGLFLLCLTGLQAQSTTDRILVDQFGYLPEGQKIAVLNNPQNGFNNGASYNPAASYELRDANTDQSVMTLSPAAWKNGQTHDQSGDQVWHLDFSSWTTAGSYYLFDPNSNVRSFEFDIAEDVYFNVAKAALKTFYFQRCGTAKTATHAGPWQDGACHQGPGQDLACRNVLQPNNASTERDLSGGWHDAGDYNKYVNFTHSVVHDLLFAYQRNPNIWTDDIGIPESGNGIPDILDEIKYELDWLLKMQLPNGSCLTKVSVTNFQGASPASADDSPRYYGEATASSTRTIASLFAHAAYIYGQQSDPSLQTYATTLTQKAELAWTWLEENPGYSFYNNSGFSSANPERSQEEQFEVQVGAAIMLFAVTGKNKYKQHFEGNYTQVRPYLWGFWYPFGGSIQDLMLFATTMQGINNGVKDDIRNNFVNSLDFGNGDLVQAVLNESDAYLAYLKNNDYVWGSNQVKANTGNLFYQAAYYGLGNQSEDFYREVAENYIHFLHGRNPINLVMLSNMSSLGGESSVNEIYHIWFGDGTDYDHAQTSPIGPPPGFVTGGFNPSYSPDGAYNGPALVPPMNQPAQKSYLDWNTSWPENSWEISEPAIYYQAAYLKLLSAFTFPGEISTSLEDPSMVAHSLRIFPNPTRDWVQLELEDPFAEFIRLEVYDQQGRQIRVQDLPTTSQTTFQVGDLSDGVYWLQLTTTLGSFREKLVVLR